MKSLFSEFMRLNSQHGVEPQIIVCDPEIYSDLLDRKIPCVCSETYYKKDNSLFNAMERSRKLVQEWHKIEVDDCTCFKDIVTYRSISKLEMVETEMITFFLPPLLDKIDLVRNIFTKDRPDEVVVFSKKSVLEKACLVVGRKFNIPVTIVGNHSLVTESIKRRLFIKKKMRVRNISFTVHIPIIFRPLRFFKLYIRHLLCKIQNAKTKRNEQYHMIKDKRYMFFSTNKKQLDAIIPLIRTINDSERDRAIVIAQGDTDSPVELEKNRIPYKLFDEYFTCKTYRKGMTQGKMLAKKWRFVEKDVDLHSRFMYNDIPLWNFIKDRFSNFFSLGCISCFIRHIETTCSIIDRECPDVIIILTERQERNKLYACAAKLKGVPTLTIQREATTDHPELGPIVTDKIAVNGIFAKNNLINRGVASEKIVITGCPRFDILYDKLTKEKEIKERVYNYLHVEREEGIVILATQPISSNVRKEDKVELLTGVFTAMKHFPDKKLVVKLHPSEEISDLYLRIGRKVGLENAIYVRDIDMHDLLLASELLITRQSNVGIDAVLAGKQLVIIYLNPNEPEIMPFVRSGVAKGIYKTDDIYPVLKSIFDGTEPQDINVKKKKRFIFEHAYKYDGQTTQRVISLLNAMADGAK